jgi:hypothetical protein
MSVAEIGNFGEYSLAAADQSAVVVPDQTALFAIVRDAQAAPPVTTQEVTGIVLLNPGTAPRLLAATAIDNMLRAQSPKTPEEQPPGIQLLLRHSEAERNLASVTGHTSISLDKAKRVELQARYKRDRSESLESATNFLGLVSVVDSITKSLEQESSTASSKLDWLRTLYGQTDDTGHPLLNALPPATAFAKENPRRKAVTEGDRILRFIIRQAFEGV